MASRAQMERMSGNGTATFTDPQDYQGYIGGAITELTVTGGGDFKARLTWLDLRRLHVLRGCESLPRIAFFSLSPAQVFVSFPTSADPPLTYGGLRLQFATSCSTAAGRERINEPMQTANGV